MNTFIAPSRLYKYLPSERTDFLRSGLLRYTPLGAFNDPFDGRPAVTAVMSKRDLQVAMNELLLSETRPAYEALPEMSKSQLSYTAYIELVAQEMAKNDSDIASTVAGFTPLFTNLLHTKFDELIGALCLTEVPDNLLMWAHYASSHAGIVLEFDSTHEYFHQQKTDEDEFRRLRRVLYRDIRPQGALTEMSFELFNVKSTHWAYEQEWRVLQPLPEADKVISGESFPVHLFEVPFPAVTAVIVGARAPMTVLSDIRQMISEFPELSHIKVMAARPDKSHFMLRIVAADA